MKCKIHGCEMVIKKKGFGWQQSEFGCPECEADEDVKAKETGRPQVIFSAGNGWSR